MERLELAFAQAMSPNWWTAYSVYEAACSFFSDTTKHALKDIIHELVELGMAFRDAFVKMCHSLADFRSKQMDNSRVICLCNMVFKKFRHRPMDALFLMQFALPLRRPLCINYQILRGGLPNPAVTTLTNSQLQALLLPMEDSKAVTQTTTDAQNYEQLVEAVGDSAGSAAGQRAIGARPDKVEAGDLVFDAFDKFCCYLQRIHPGIERKYLEDTKALMVFGQLKGGAPVDTVNAKTGTTTTKVVKRMTIIRKLIKKTCLPASTASSTPQ